MLVHGKGKFGSLLRNMSIVLSMVILFSQMLVGVTMAEDNESVNNTKVTSAIEVAIAEAAQHLASLDNLSDWAALGIAKSGYEVPDSYISNAKAALLERKGSYSKVTDLERLAITIAALGYDPQNFQGFNLINSIFNHPNMMRQGINGPIHALIVLNSGSYNLPASNLWNKNNLLETVLNQQNDDGGWSLSAGGKSTVDITAMALTALSPFNDSGEVKSRIDKAVAWLSSVQLANGGFNDGGDNSESAAQVIIALSSLGIDAETFIQSGNSVVNHLLSFRETDGGFAHMDGLGNNGMATEQALLGLLAYESFSKGEQFTLYDTYELQANVDIRIEGIQGVVAAGTTTGATAFEALSNFAMNNNLQLGVKDTSVGKYIHTIGDLREGMYGGYEGWSFNILRDGSWQFPAVAMTDYAIQQGDTVVLYYTDYSTQMVEQVIVEPALPKEAQPFTVTVTQSNWNWDNNQVVVTPAQAVLVTVGDQTVVSDERGKAYFANGIDAGTYELIISGYRSESTPSVVRHVEHITIHSKKVAATYAVEGLDHTITEGSVLAETALEGFEQLLIAKNVPYKVNQLSIGQYVADIDHLHEGALGGFDGWGFVVKRDGEWVFPVVGIADFTLEAGDHVVVYYTNYATDPIQSIEVTPVMPKANEPISVVVKKGTWDWDNNQLSVQPADGVKVEIASLMATTDSSGTAIFTDGFPVGKHTITVSGNRANDAPSVIRATSELYILADQQHVSRWAHMDVQKVLMYGVMYGVNSSSLVFDAKRSMTRAEYVALLLRLIDEKPLTDVRSGYNDIPASIWYEGSVAKARQLEIIDKSVANFQPDNAITREELAVMTAKALKLSTAKEITGFNDLGLAKESSIPYIAAIAENGILLGNDGEFMPLSPVTREMAAAVAVRIHEGTKYE